MTITEIMASLEHLDGPFPRAALEAAQQLREREEVQAVLREMNREGLPRQPAKENL